MTSLLGHLEAICFLLTRKWVFMDSALAVVSVELGVLFQPLVRNMKVTLRRKALNEAQVHTRGGKIKPLECKSLGCC